MYKPFPRGSAIMIKQCYGKTSEGGKTEGCSDLLPQKENGPMACFRVSVIKLSCSWVCHVSLIVATYLCSSVTAH